MVTEKQFTVSDNDLLINNHPEASVITKSDSSHQPSYFDMDVRKLLYVHQREFFKVSVYDAIGHKGVRKLETGQQQGCLVKQASHGLPLWSLMQLPGFHSSPQLFAVRYPDTSFLSALTTVNHRMDKLTQNGAFHSYCMVLDCAVVQ